MMNISKPSYERAPITGKNLQLMMDAYYPEYKAGPVGSYDGIAQNFHLYTSSDAHYNTFSMDDMEQLCLRAKPNVLIVATQGEKGVWTRVDILRAILINSIKAYRNTVQNPANRLFIGKLGQLLDK